MVNVRKNNDKSNTAHRDVYANKHGSGTDKLPAMRQINTGLYKLYLHQAEYQKNFKCSFFNKYQGYSLTFFKYLGVILFKKNKSKSES